MEDIDQRAAALAKAAPNMKALEQFDAIKVTLPGWCKMRLVGARNCCAVGVTQPCMPLRSRS